MRKDERIHVAGHRGLVGSAIVRRLQSEGFENLILRGRDQLDLRDAAAVDRFYRAERPDCTIVAAAKVGGILANQTFPAEFIRDNLAIQTHLIHSAWEHGTRKLLFLGSSCIYPRDCPQPIREEYLLTGPLEASNEAYAIAKIAGLKMCQAYRRQYGFDAIVAMPTNLYGPGDNFHPERSHVLPALMRRIHEAHLRGDREVVIWGSGTPRREFLHVDDLADAVLFMLERYSGHDCVNVGTGEDLSILELAGMIADVVGFKGEIALDRTKPDGTPRKLLAVDRLRKLGWSASIDLRSGIADTYRWFLAHQDQVRT
jgi:GDP-L-fucose synthase